MVYIIIENPQTEIPYTENPLAEIPLSENPTLLNTNDNKVRNIKNIDNNIPKEKKQKLGTYFNVLLSDKELQKLVEKMGSEKTGAVIANFSELKEMKGYKYKSDYLAILRWGIEAYEKKNASPNKNSYVNSRRPASDSKVGEIDF